MVCPIEVHDALKLDEKKWLALPLVGYQKWFDDEPALEHRNCPCGSTLVKPVEEEK